MVVMEEKNSIRDAESFFGKHIWMTIILLIILYDAIAHLVYYGLRNVEYLDDNYYIIFLIKFALFALLLMIIVPYVMKIQGKNRGYKEFLKDIRITKIKPLIRIIGLGILTAGVVLACVLVTLLISDQLYTVSFELDIKAILGSTSAIYTSLIPGIWEEVLFRGIIITLLLKKYSEKESILLSALLFGFSHNSNLMNSIYYSDSTLFYHVIGVQFQVIFTFFWGIMFGYLFIKTKSLVPGMILHYLFNTFNGVFILRIEDPISWIWVVGVIYVYLAKGVAMFFNIGIIKVIYTKFPEKTTISTDAMGVEYCPNCGEQSQREDKFCKKCGVIIKNNTGVEN